MCYRLTSHYLVLCDRCGLTAPEGAGWTTPSCADAWTAAVTSTETTSVARRQAPCTLPW